MHYLQRRAGVYYYRQRLPKEIGSGSITKSLKTKDHPTAKHLLKLIAYNVSLLFTDCKGGTVSVERIRFIVSQYIDWILQEHEREQAEKPSRSIESITDYIKTLENAQSDIREAFISNNQRQAEANLQFFIETSSNPPTELQHIQKGTTEYRELLREILKADVEIGEEVIRRTKGDYSSDFNQSYSDASSKLKREKWIFAPVHECVSNEVTSTTSSKLASEALEVFIQDRKISKGWTHKTENNSRSRIEGFITIVGDKPVNQYTREDIYTYRSKLQKLPPNMNKIKKFQGLGIDEVIALNEGDEVIAVKTVQNHLMWVGSFFEWMANNQYIPHNIAKDIQVADKSNPINDRSPFTREDLAVLFGQLPEYTEGLSKTIEATPYRVWIPLLGLYHGMRLNEVCQLFEDDIIEVDALPCIRITNNEGRLQRVKNKGSHRTIPIHPKLIEIGFLEFVQARRKEAPQQQLFPHLTPTRDGYGKNMTYWFNNRALTITGIKGKNSKKDFHSFRHTVTDVLKNSDIRLEHYQALLGHSSGSVTLDTYGSSLRPATLLNVLNAVRYDVPELHAFEEHVKALMNIKL